MNFKVLSPAIQSFINESLNANISKIALAKNPFPDIAWTDIVNQIAAKSKAKEKLPTWFNQANIVYPSKVSIEQTSSEITAKYKSDIISGKTLIDLTGGFGVDDYYFSKKFNRVIHCELKADLHQITKHNFTQLRALNIECINGDSSLIIGELKQHFDYIYIDPSRRTENKEKVFMLKHCSPNIPENLNYYFYYTNLILIKTSPLLDISLGIKELNNVKEIHIVAVNNEVKEILWILEKDYYQNIFIKTINISKENNQEFNFYQDETNCSCKYSLPKDYLYEPNAPLLKSGAFELIGNKYLLNKLHFNSHLYTSSKKINFPGRIFKIENIIPYAKKEMKEQLKDCKANVSMRNFPESVSEIRKKWKIQDGGDIYLFFTTNINEEKIVIRCTKV